MESLALLSPSINTRLISSSSTSVCLKVFLPHNRRATQQCVNNLCHRGWFKRLDSFSIQPFESFAVSWKVCTANLGGDVVVEESPTKERSKSEFGEGTQISEVENQKGDTNFQATKHGQVQWVGDVVVEETPTKEGSKSELAEGAQICEVENLKVETNLQATKHGQVQWAGDVIVEESPTKERSKSELDGAQISDVANQKVETNLQATKHGQERWAGKRYAPRIPKNITVGLDALKSGAVLTGKVTNIERFGAFVDVGAFISGLIHISNLSKNFVHSIEDVVKVGQEVKVEVVYLNVNSRRLSLKLIREAEEPKVEKPISLPEPPDLQKKNEKIIPEKSSSNAAGRPQKGELITGVVAKIVSAGVYVTLKQGHQGFLPASEVLSIGAIVETTSFFRLGQQIPARVLRTTKNRITLTMKKQSNAIENREAVIIAPEDRATSPFEIAFRRNEVIARFLEERERLQNILNDHVDESPVIQSATEIEQS